MSDEILVADIGGTNARFAIALESQGRIELTNVQVFLAEDFENLFDAVDAYLKLISAKPRLGCFAAAGPIIDGAVDFTNSPWTLRSADIAEPLQFAQFRIVNDFYALAMGVMHLPPDTFVEVKKGNPVTTAPQLVIGAGTGLGQALIVPTPAKPEVIATEGGHISFSPCTDEEFEIRKFLAQEHARVSVERLLSGHGLVNIHRALSMLEGIQYVALRANEITEAAKTGSDEISVKAVDLFCAILGSVAGDAVLATGARGGVILGGGILPKIKDVFLQSSFVDRFLEKGRMIPYVESTPIKMIVKDNAALYGAAGSLTT